MERLSYSEDGANKRVRVARLVQRFPQALDELASGHMHITGLFVLSGRLTEDNVERLLGEARGKSKRQIEELIAKWRPRPDVPTTIIPSPGVAHGELSTVSGAGNTGPSPSSAPRTRLEPLSPACAPYTCEGSACLGSCSITSDCAAGSVCDEGRCVDAGSKSSDDAGCGCRTHGERAPARHAPAAVALAALLALAVRRRPAESVAGRERVAGASRLG